MAIPRMFIVRPMPELSRLATWIGLNELLDIDDDKAAATLKDVDKDFQQSRVLGRRQLKEYIEELQAPHCANPTRRKRNLSMITGEQELRDSAITRIFLIAPLDVIGIHAKRSILLVEFQCALKHEVCFSAELVIGKSGQMKLTVGLGHRDAFCLKRK